MSRGGLCPRPARTLAEPTVSVEIASSGPALVLSVAGPAILAATPLRETTGQRGGPGAGRGDARLVRERVFEYCLLVFGPAGGGQFVARTLWNGVRSVSVQVLEQSQIG
jgi:hypothetical protein